MTTRRNFLKVAAAACVLPATNLKKLSADQPVKIVDRTREGTKFEEPHIGMSSCANNIDINEILDCFWRTVKYDIKFVDSIEAGTCKIKLNITYDEKQLGAAIMDNRRVLMGKF